jgi:hypothetical protein
VSRCAVACNAVDRSDKLWPRMFCMPRGRAPYGSVIVARHDEAMMGRGTRANGCMMVVGAVVTSILRPMMWKGCCPLGTRKGVEGTLAGIAVSNRDAA